MLMSLREEIPSLKKELALAWKTKHGERLELALLDHTRPKQKYEAGRIKQYDRRHAVKREGFYHPDRNSLPLAFICLTEARSAA